MIEQIREWLLTCPLLSGQRLNINHLSGDALEFSILESPTTPVLKRYMDGSTMRQKAVSLTATKDQTPDILQNLAESGFWENFSEWVEAQNKNRSFPALPGDCWVQSVAVTSTHYLMAATAATARWQIQLSITYFKKGER